MVDKREIISSWDFNSANTKEYTHCYHSYPAMMIPQIPRRIIKEYLPKKSNLILDPFCGSGTTLVEGKLAGLNSVGFDLNPLARIISLAKTTNFDINSIKNDTLLLKDYIIHYKYSKQYQIPNFKNINFWFREDVSEQLSFLKYLINNKISKDNYYFFIVVLSETIREVSYTRNSEFKLYRINKNKINKHNVNTFSIFIKKIERNINGLIDFNKNTNKKILTEVLDVNICNDINGSTTKIFENGVDMVLTSPPYGDSKTTVAYGQFSRLSHEWLGIRDSQKVDNELMGGRLIKSDEKVLWLQSVKQTLKNIKNIDEKRYYQVCSFLGDYIDSIKNIAKIVNKNGVVAYVVGNRMVKSNQIDLDLVTSEIFQEFGLIHKKTLVRNILNKKMPRANSPTNEIGKPQQTINNEYIVILKK